MNQNKLIIKLIKETKYIFYPFFQTFSEAFKYSLPDFFKYFQKEHFNLSKSN